MDPSGGQPRLGFVPELVGVPGPRRARAGEVGAEDLDITTAGAQNHLSEDAKPGGVSVRCADGAWGDEDELSAH